MFKGFSESYNEWEEVETVWESRAWCLWSGSLFI